MHICWDEIQIFLFGLPFIGFGLTWLRLKFSRRKATCDHASGEKHA